MYWVFVVLINGV